ncbi:MAG: hypothetical protein DRO98_05680 [Archaeoglobales archaeon]|nr:MAG: hypothetical protein DRO98_05680 [Archaeoglobales archaeon]
MKVRKVTSILIKTSLFLLGWGILATSFELVAVSIIPLLFLAIPHFITVNVERARITGGSYIGEEFETEIDLRATGFGILKAMHKLPEHFELVEGSNAIATFVLGRNDVKIRYKAKPMRRGNYKLDRIVLELEHPFLAWKTDKELRVELELEVKQRLRRITRVETLRGIARSPMPDVDISKIGVPGTDFREIRDYVAGDPMKFINWKATARRNKLMVNQYEVEGKKAVWIFVDANHYMTFGKSVRNYLECAIEIANALTYYFVSRGHKVGLYVVGRGICLYPDVGKRQFKRISEELMRIEAGEESFDQAFEKCKKLLAIYKPLIILITRPEYSKPVRFVSEVIKAKIPVQIIALKGKIYGDEFAVSLFEILRRYTLKSLRRANLIEWDIDKPIRQLMVRVIG